MKQYTVGVDFGTLSARAILLDLSSGEEVATGHLTLSLGGGPIASLITASRLGAKVRLATCLGQDRFSMIARDFLEQESIPYRSFPASLAEGQSPVNVTSVMSIPGVDRSFVSYFPTTDFYSAPSPELVRYIGDSAYCIASSPNAALFHALQESGCRVIYDVGWSDDLCIELLSKKEGILLRCTVFRPEENSCLCHMGMIQHPQTLFQCTETTRADTSRHRPRIISNDYNQLPDPMRPASFVASRLSLSTLIELTLQSPHATKPHL